MRIGSVFSADCIEHQQASLNGGSVGKALVYAYVDSIQDDYLDVGIWKESTSTSIQGSDTPFLFYSTNYYS